MKTDSSDRKVLFTGHLKVDKKKPEKIEVPGLFILTLPLFHNHKDEEIEMEINIGIGVYPTEELIYEVIDNTKKAIDQGNVPQVEGYYPLNKEQFREVARDTDIIPGKLSFKYPLFKADTEIPREMVLNYRAGELPSIDSILNKLKAIDEEIARGEMPEIHGYSSVPLNIFIDVVETEDKLIKRLSEKVFVDQPSGVQ